MDSPLLVSTLRFISQAVLNGVWQTALIVALTTLVLLFSRKKNASTRYAIWLSVLFLILLIPFAAAYRASTPSVSVPMTMPMPMPAQPPVTPANSPLIVVSFLSSKIILVFLATVSGIRLIKLFRSWHSLLQVKHSALQPPENLNRRFEQMAAEYGISRRVSLRIAPDNGFPLTIGFRNPVVLIPETVAQNLEPQELEQIWMHELGHIQRRDDWTRLIQKTFEAILFFYPAVFWIGKQLDLQREIACDDMVLMKTGTARSYANCLTRLIELSSWRNSALAPGALLSKSQFCRRIEMLLNKDRNRTISIYKTGFIPAIAVLVIALACLLRVSPLIAVAPDDEARLRMQAAEGQLHAAEQHMWAAAEQTKTAQDDRTAMDARQRMNAGRAEMRAALKEMEQAKQDLLMARHEMRIRMSHEIMALKRMEITMPKISVHVPAMDIRIPEQHLMIAGQAVDIEAQRVHVDPVHVEVPQNSFDIYVPDVPEAPPAPEATAAPGPPEAPEAIEPAAGPRAAAPEIAPAPPAPVAMATPAIAATPRPPRPVAAPVPAIAVAPVVPPTPAPKATPARPCNNSEPRPR
jgi:beta-lactamase regulating signal transducer with metallopeptidase domain